MIVVVICVGLVLLIERIMSRGAIIITITTITIINADASSIQMMIMAIISTTFPSLLINTIIDNLIYFSFFLSLLSFTN